MQTVKFLTLGCKVNQYETQSIRERFLLCGFKEIDNHSPADTYLINTCTVTAIADRKSKNIIRHCIKENPRARIIITGCLVEKDAAELAAIKGIDFIISKRFFPEGIINFSGHNRAFLKIQDGCDNFCAYCKVPLVRGKSRSRPIKEIIQEAVNLVKNGFREIVLSGICLGLYGKDLIPQLTLSEVIAELEKFPELFRIRLSSIEANDLSHRLIEKITQTPKVCKHLHIPLQSGDTEILHKMNRRISAQGYLELIQKLKTKMPEIAITTDVMVGFPGESAEHFNNTVKLIQEVVPLKVHIFPYSPRKGTLASNFPEKLNFSTIRQRISRLEEAARESAWYYKKQFLDREMQVFCEAPARRLPGYWQGYSDNYLKILVKSAKNLNNQIVRVRLKKVFDDYILAE